MQINFRRLPVVLVCAARTRCKHHRASYFSTPARMTAYAAR
jgi:hypothetical protein